MAQSIENMIIEHLWHIWEELCVCVYFKKNIFLCKIRYFFQFLPAAILSITGVLKFHSNNEGANSEKETTKYEDKLVM